MTDLVSPLLIESIVGVERHPYRHYGRAVSAQRRVYILHSRACLASGVDLRDCSYSLALDRHGIDPATWPEDVPVLLSFTVGGGQLRPEVLS